MTVLRTDPLYTDPARLKDALSAQQQEPSHSALLFLTAPAGAELRRRPTPTRQDKTATTPVLKRPLTAAEQMLADATAFAMLEDTAAGERATAFLLTARYGLSEAPSAAVVLRELVSALQTADLLQAEPTFSANAHDWYRAIRQRYEQAVAQASQQADPHSADRLWAHTASVVVALFDDNPALLADGIAGLKEIVDTIHPEGYLRLTVEAGNPLAAFTQMVDMTGALVLGAEAAQQAGENLWGYENRGVSINTAAAYVVSHYFYPQKWRWDGPLEAEAVTDVLVREGAFLEMAALRYPLHATHLLLDDLRPLFSLHYGGLTTLTHAPRPETVSRKRRFPWG